MLGGEQNRTMLRWVSALGATARNTTKPVRSRIGKRNKAISRRAGRVKLLPAVVFAIVAGVGVAVIAYWVLHKLTPTSNAQAAPIDLTKVALTVVAGVGGVVALVIAYRRQRDIEQSRFVERFGAAAAQLGATDVAVRIAGVYAMAGVADETDGLRQQQCIDVLCGYLRLPYSPELGANHQSKLVVKHHRATADNTRADDQERHHEYRHNDREVRATILRVIADHLRLNAEYSWSTRGFDFRTAYLENVDFSRVRFLNSARFDDAIFSGNAGFDGATFSSNARFGGANFSGNTGFDGATFCGDTWFDGATFSGNTRFEDATFCDAAWFGGATFSGSNTRFDGTTFSGNTRFGGASFVGYVQFKKVDFGSGPISFVDPRQWGPPAPKFDWDQDIDQKPANIEPQAWPPAGAEGA
ncbi:pentapeptide repeat-containing protein [Nocardia sp. NPDC051052]|uniref:pentapeptide repeat-containing protein n=1 Tax=Nocardia sp. NPDC051052 TaxID=3364322 RepID=UPI00379B89BD